MPIAITCPSCDTSYDVADELEGKKVRCRTCKQPVRVQSEPQPRKKRDRKTKRYPSLWAAIVLYQLIGAVAILGGVLTFFIGIGLQDPIVLGTALLVMFVVPVATFPAADLCQLFMDIEKHTRRLAEKESATTVTCEAETN